MKGMQASFAAKMCLQNQSKRLAIKDDAFLAFWSLDCRTKELSSVQDIVCRYFAAKI